MAKTHTQNVLALSVAALVASGVAAFAGVATFNDDLMGKSVNLAQGEMCPGGCPMGQWCNYETHSCQASDASPPSGDPSGVPSGGTPPSTTTSTTTSTTSGPTGLNCAGGSLAACQKTCVKDGITNTFCTGYCAKECPSTSTTTTSTTTTVTNRCAYVTEGDGCMAKCTCYVENTSSCSGTPKSGEVAFCNAVKGADAAKTGKTGVFNMTTCSNYCDELKAVPPPAPIVEELVPAAPVVMPAEPVSTQSLVEPARMAVPAGDDFESGDDDFGDFDDFSDGFHGGPGDFDDFSDGDFDMGFGGPDEEFMRAMMDQYGGEFSLGNDDFSGYFGEFGPGMGGGDFGFGGEFGGGFGDDFGGMPPWMEDELENTKDMMRGMAEDMCSELVEEIDEIEDFEGMENLGFRMQEECMGGDMGGGGPPDPEMMENAVEMLKIFGDKDGPVYFALDVAKKHDVFTDAEVGEIEDILVQIGEKAEKAEEACSDLPDMDEGDFFGLRGLLAQLFDDEEEDDGDEEFDEDGEDEDDDFFGDGDEGGFGGDEIRQAFEACGSILDEALGAGPGQDEEEMGSGLMGELETLMREPMEAAVEDGTIPQEEWAEVENRFNTVMEELGFEGEFEDHEFDDDSGEDFDEGEDEEEGGEEFDDEDFDF